MVYMAYRYLDLISLQCFVLNASIWGVAFAGGRLVAYIYYMYMRMQDAVARDCVEPIA